MNIEAVFWKALLDMLLATMWLGGHFDEYVSRSWSFPIGIFFIGLSFIGFVRIFNGLLVTS